MDDTILVPASASVDVDGFGSRLDMSEFSAACSLGFMPLLDVFPGCMQHILDLRFSWFSHCGSSETGKNYGKLKCV